MAGVPATLAQLSAYPRDSRVRQKEAVSRAIATGHPAGSKGERLDDWAWIAVLDRLLRKRAAEVGE